MVFNSLTFLLFSSLFPHLVAESGLPGIHSGHEPALRGFDCPDGSHLDVRDRGRYTAALADVMKRQGLVAPRHDGGRK